MRFGPDGALYMGGAGGSADLGDLGNWNWNGTWTGLQKLVPNGKTPFDMLAIRALADGFEIEFTQPLAPGAEAAGNFSANHWRYLPTAEYGGPKMDQAKLTVLSAVLSPERKRLRLRLGGLRAGFVVHLKASNVKSAAGESLWADEAWYTLNLLGPPMAGDGQPRLLAFSRTLGYRHEAIPDAAAALQAMGKAEGYLVDTTGDPAVFTSANLARYQAVFFNHVTGEVLDSSQREAFRGYIRSGGGFAALHAASAALETWPWYGGLVGAYFKDHSGVVSGSLRIEDRGHPSTAGLPADWTRVEEWYNFKTNPRPAVKVLMTVDEATYAGGNMGTDHPIAWFHAYEGGRAWYSALGHTPESYRDSLFLGHLRGGIAYAMGHTRTGLSSGRTDRRTMLRPGLRVPAAVIGGFRADGRRIPRTPH